MLKVLRETLLLSCLSEEHLARVARHATRVRLHDGQLLFSQGDVADRFYLVTTGRLRLFSLSLVGDEKVIEIVESGETFAEALMFIEAGCYPVGAAAIDQTELISMDLNDFKLMLRESVETCFLLLGVLSQRLNAWVHEISNLTLHSASSRFACYLLAKLPPQSQTLALEVPKGIIASRLSIKPETFSRIEKDLSDRGIIRIKGMCIFILDKQALREVAALGTSRRALRWPDESTAHQTTPHRSSQSAEPGRVGKPGAASPSGLQISQEQFERADQALYAAKQTGRNRVSVNRVSG